MSEIWKVTAQAQTMMQTSGGQWIEAMKVTFRTTSGVEGFVMVPLNQYGAQAVAQLIDARTAAIDSVTNL